MHIPSDNYDDDEKSRIQLLISNEQQHVLSSDPQVLTRVIPTMERAQGLLGILEVVSDCQPLPALRVLVIIEPINIVYPGTVFKCNNIKIELTMKEKYC
jgi:hypothetical protein